MFEPSTVCFGFCCCRRFEERERERETLSTCFLHTPITLIQFQYCHGSTKIEMPDFIGFDTMQSGDTSGGDQKVYRCARRSYLYVSDEN